ncbi:MAG: DUF2512 family protein [Bacillota bacterium]
MKLVGFFVKLGLYVVAHLILIPLLTNGGFGFAVVSALVVAAIGYLADLTIMPRVGNWLAAGSDFLLAPISVWLTKVAFYPSIDLALGDLFIIGFVAAGVEILWHRLMARTFMGEMAK